MIFGVILILASLIAFVVGLTDDKRKRAYQWMGIALILFWVGLIYIVYHLIKRMVS